MTTDLPADQAGEAVSATERREITDDLDALLGSLPPEILKSLEALPRDRELIEIVMDLGRQPEARFGGGGEQVLLDREIVEADIQYVVDHIGSFGEDNRAGIERTLHRISAIRNRSGKIVGLTCRIGRAVFGTIEIIADLVETGRSVLIMGRPGIGKTTMLREAARVLADDVDKRVVVVDTSNEIAGDGDIPHPGIGRARRMQVPTPAQQHAVMIEAVENHMPEVIVIDEIGTELEASAARTIAERGVQLIGTAHGNNLDNLMLNPTLSDLIGGIQSVTLGDEEARRRRTQKSVLERKAPPTFDVIVEIQDRERVTVHTDVADTVDALLRGDPLAPELRWRDEGGVHKSQSRPRPSPAQMPGERFSGLVGGGGTAPGWRPEPGWRPDARRGEGGFREATRGARPGYRPGASGGWRGPRSRSQGGRATGPSDGPGEPWEGAGGGGTGAGGAGGSGGTAAGGGSGGVGGTPGPGPIASLPGVAPAAPFMVGGIADRGPLERGTLPTPEPRARDSRELDRQRQWRQSATRAIDALHADAGTGPVSEPPDDEDEDEAADTVEGVGAAAPVGEPLRLPGPAAVPAEPDLIDEEDGDDDEDLDDDEESLAGGSNGYDRLGATAPDGYATSLPTVHVLAFGISRKRLEQAIRELQLPVILVREVEEADAVVTLRNYFRQKAPALRDAEDRALPIYVLKANTIRQMEACLTSMFSLEVDPGEAAMRETAEAIGLVQQGDKPIELSPQNAYIRRLQHQMAEQANLVSRSRGREPYRRVRLYPDRSRVWR